ncbi:MAG: helix-turn-helix domain-containing protein [Acidimicrobiales bacterium]
MLAVLDDGDHVERDLRSGVLRCPSCGGQLGPWGWARARELRAARSRMLRPRRARCRTCAATHVLVPICALLRRRDNIEVIGAALVAKHAGQGHRRIGASTGLPASTVRGWLRRFTKRAEGLRTLATVMALDLDPMHPAIQPRGSPFGDALEALGLASSAAVRRLGPARSGWAYIAALTRGLMLATGPVPSR